MFRSTTKLLLLATAGCCLAACGGGGGGGGSGLNPIPAPPQNPPPPPPPPPTAPPLPPGPIGLVSDEPFATVSARTDGSGALWTESGAVEISYSAAEDRYTMTIPGYQEGHLADHRGYGSFNAGSNTWSVLRGTTSDLTLGAGPATQDVQVTVEWPATTPYSYTDFGAWYGNGPMGAPQGVFAYGIPTAAGDVPVVGSATYSGEIRGITDGLVNGTGNVGYILDVSGSVSLSFDFGAGTLAGEMNPVIYPVWDPVALGTYTFRDTVYSTGSTTFSGAFNVPGATGPSSFAGSFTGPQAAELFGRWEAPFQYPDTTDVGRMSGVWIAKKDN